MQFLVLRFVIRTTFVVAQLSRIGNHDMIAWHPTGHRLIEDEIHLSCNGLRDNRAKVGDFTEPCMLILPRPSIPVPICAGSIARSIDWSAMMISAVTFGRTGFVRRTDFESSLIHHCQVRDFHSGVLIGCETQNAVDLYAIEPCVLAVSKIIVWPFEIRTLSLPAGTLPVDHVFDSDHEPLLMLVTVGRVQK